MNRYEKVLNGAALWASYFRENPDRFVESYLHISLRLFQRILIVMMFWSTTFVFIACRGIGKTFLCAVYCVTRCILFPRTQICIASGTRGQAALVLDKIMIELKAKSPELCAEINNEKTVLNNSKAQIAFKNHSLIKVVTAGESARGNRCNVLVLDEFRLLDKDTIDTILKKFLNYRRMPDYVDLTEAERNAEYDKEKNLSMYLSSAWYKNHWSYTKCDDAFTAMTGGRRQFVCAFPYQLSLLEGLLDRESVADDMAETNFSEVKFLMEMGAMFYGSTENAFFDFETVSRNRKLQYPMLTDKQASLLQSQTLRIQPKKRGEFRILSADIALMSSRKHKNDATSVFINQVLPTNNGRYINNIVFSDTFEGKRTEEQALIIRRLFDAYDCDYIVLDANGVGLGVYDSLTMELVDPDTGEYYTALSCCNDRAMAERCTYPNAPKVIWSVKASAQFNSDCAFMLREGFRSGRIRLLLNEFEADETLGALKGYKALSPSDQAALMLPYIQTTLLIDELVNLQHEEVNGKLRIYEKSGRRKDRYSSLSYNYYVSTQIENKYTRIERSQSDGAESFLFRAPGQNGKAVKKFETKGAGHRWS